MAFVRSNTRRVKRLLLVEWWHLRSWWEAAGPGLLSPQVEDELLLLPQSRRCRQLSLLDFWRSFLGTTTDLRRRALQMEKEASNDP